MGNFDLKPTSARALEETLRNCLHHVEINVCLDPGHMHYSFLIKYNMVVQERKSCCQNWNLNILSLHYHVLTLDA